MMTSFLAVMFSSSNLCGTSVAEILGDLLPIRPPRQLALIVGLES